MQNIAFPEKHPSRILSRSYTGRGSFIPIRQVEIGEIAYQNFVDVRKIRHKMTIFEFSQVPTQRDLRIGNSK